MIRKISILLICIFLSGCATAKRYTKEDEDGIEADYLEMKGPGKAEWSDGAKIETLKFPSLPIKYEQ